MRRLILTTVSALALGLGGFGLTYAADNTGAAGPSAGRSNMPATSGTTQPGTMGNTAGTNMPSPAGASQPGYATQSAETGTSNWGTSGRMDRRSEITEVQQKLQQDGLYQGKIDGRLGRETRHALQQYQKQNGLRVTANLDRETRDSLLGQGAMSHGSTNGPTMNQQMTPSHSGGSTNAPR
jgi:peptidoglycan hydrolase-like protein with peptidoglycan-binding domain